MKECTIEPHPDGSTFLFQGPPGTSFTVVPTYAQSTSPTPDQIARSCASTNASKTADDQFKCCVTQSTSRSRSSPASGGTQPRRKREGILTGLGVDYEIPDALTDRRQMLRHWGWRGTDGTLDSGQQQPSTRRTPAHPTRDSHERLAPAVRASNPFVWPFSWARPSPEGYRSLFLRYHSANPPVFGPRPLQIHIRVATLAPA
jgi:hypothetical protein